jgi:beta-galactosidase/beta-glucuronidase
MINRRIILAAFTALLAVTASAQYSPAGNRIKTKWADQMDVNNVWKEYPRPIMQRDAWQNLNGLWNYAVLPKGKAAPQKFDGKILVPFAIESSLSGVGRTLGQENELWYQRQFTVPGRWKGKRVMLNFGAVDWKADVWVNGMKVGMHTGGYVPFSFDITAALQSGNNTVVVRVFDPTDKSYQPRGKQSSNPHGIWYTPVSGIWQTVWIEPVAENHIASLKITPDIDANTVTVDAARSDADASVVTEVKVFDGGKVVASSRGTNNQPVEVTMPENVKLWSPDSPYLYNMVVTITKNGKVLDEVKSYTAMRKFSAKRDDKGIMRLQLNDKNIFEFGPLDQGWWPDGLYTAPCYEAMIYDLQKEKEWGFNMVRKHIKVEPALWYNYCDKAGIIVWQDMPSGDKSPEWQPHQYFTGNEKVRSAESEANYRKEWKEIIDNLYSYPCISTWIPFNESWGQFKTPEIAAWTKQYDPTRLVNPASGGNFYTVGDMLDLHNYPEPKLYLCDASRVTVLGEYGGIGSVVKDHVWNPEWVPGKNWGYENFNTNKEVTDEYVSFGNMLIKLAKQGFSAGVYTQTTDVEIEVNGLMTYDRKVIKMEEDRLKQINKEIINCLNE